jgi:hypothetical protein
MSLAIIGCAGQISMGGGKKALINVPLAATDARAPDYRGHAPLVEYRPSEWKRHLVSDAERGVMHGIFIADWDHNGRDAILIGSFSVSAYIGLSRTESGREWKSPAAVRNRGRKAGRAMLWWESSAENDF